MKGKIKIVSVAINFLLGLLVVGYTIALFFTEGTFVFDNNTIEFAVYILLSLIPILSILIFGIMSYFKTGEKQKIAILCVFALIFTLFIVAFANFESSDYLIFLKPWYDEYAKSSFSSALYNIVDVSNYTPAYNYFLVIIAQLGLNCLYSVKFLTLIFSLLLAFSIERIIDTISKSKFSYVRFMLVLLLPPVLMESSQWGQCDAIYTSFAMLSFLFALKKKSKLSFMFVGLSFAFKLQVLFVVPVLFIMLIVKDENGDHYLKWKDIWIAPIMYSVNLIPVFAGRPLGDLLMIYFNQSTYDTRLSGDCGNLCLFYELLKIRSGHQLYNLILVMYIAITALVLVFYLWVVFKLNKRKRIDAHDLVFFGMAFSFSMVFLMPKMLDRFYFIAMCFAFIYTAVKNTSKSRIIFLLILTTLFLPMSYIVLLNMLSLFIAVFTGLITQIYFIFRFVVLGNKDLASLSRDKIDNISQ